MAIAVRLGPPALGRRRLLRVVELERIFTTAVELDEVFDGYGLLTTGGPEGLADGQLSTA